jgi:type VII secretion integral membrane protein EccD
MPSIIDILDNRAVDGSGAPAARRYRLARPGAAALSTSTTLAQHGIRDGEVLVLTESPTPLPAPRCEDVAEAVSATMTSTARQRISRNRQAARLTGAIAASVLTGIGGLTLIRNAVTANVTGTTVGVMVSAALVALVCGRVAHRTCGDAFTGLAFGVLATVFAAVAGYLAVPGPPGLPNVVLGAMTSAVTSVLALRLSGCGAAALSAIACVATIIAAAAFVGVTTCAPPHVVGSVSALICLGLLGVAARIAIAVAGLSPQLPPAPDMDARAIRAGTWLTGLIAAFACGAAVAAVATALAGPPGPPRVLFGALTGASLLLRAHRDDGRGGPVLMACGTMVIATTFGVVATSMLRGGSWTAAMTATLAAAAIYLGFVAPTVSLSPPMRRAVDVLECLALVAMVPMTCWVCGLYGTVRGLNLT